MLGQLGLRLFTASLLAMIIIYHFFSKIWALSWVPIVCYAAGGLGFILWAVFSIERIVTWFQKRSSQFGLSVVLSTLAILGLIGVGNWLSLKKNCLPFTKECKLDLTRSGLHTLSDQTKKILGAITEDITLEVWSTDVKAMSGAHDMRRFLDNYVQSAQGKLKLIVKDPREDRIEAEQKRVTRNNVIVVQSASGRESRVENFNDSRAEEQITNAIIQAIKPNKKTLCFTTGHGEIASADKGDGLSMSMLKESLENSSYGYKEVQLITEKSVPADCEALISIGPRSHPESAEVASIKSYLEKGGRLLALWGVDTPAAWQEVLAPYGVKLANNLLIDPRVQGAPAVYTKSYAPDSDIVKNFTIPLLLVMARSIDVPAKAPDQVSVKSVVNTERGTLETPGDLKALKTGKLSMANARMADTKSVVVHIKKVGMLMNNPPPKGGDKKGMTKTSETPSSSGTTVETNIVVVGNSMIASNGLAQKMGNMDFLLNSVSFLMKDDSLIGIRPKDVKSAKLELTRENINQVQGYLLLLSLCFVILAVRVGFRRQTV